MAKNLQSVQLLRSGQVYATKEAAKAGLEGLLTASTPTDLDGIAALARYSGETASDVKSIVGFFYKSGDVKTVTIMDFDSADFDALKTEVNNIETAVGLNADGTHATSIGKYTSAATTIEGEIVALDTKIQQTSAASVANDNKVITDVTQTEATITATASLLTGVKLSGYTAKAITDAKAEIESGNTLGQALSNIQHAVNVNERVASQSLNELNARILALDLATVSGAGEVITSVSQEDGLVSAATTQLQALTLNGFTADATKSGNVAATDTLTDAINKLQNNTANASFEISGVTGQELIDLGVNVREAYKLVRPGTTEHLGEYIKIYKDSAIKNVQLGRVDDTLTNEDPTTHESTASTIVTGTGATALDIVYQLANGNYKLVTIDVSEFLDESEFEDGLEVTSSGTVKVKIDSASEQVATGASASGAVLSVSADGVKVSNIKNAIDYKISTLTAASVANENNVITDVTEADGIISATSANITGVKLSGYSVASSAADVASTDTLGQALGKLQKRVNDMALTDTCGESEVYSGITESKGVTTVGKKNLTSVKLAGYSAKTDTDEKVEIASGDTLGEALSKLQHIINVNETVASQSLNDLNSRIKELSGDAIETVQVNGTALAVSSNTVNVQIAAAAASGGVDNPITVSTDNSTGAVTIGFASSIDCGTF